MDSGLLAQAVVMGDGEASLSAVLVPASPQVGPPELATLIAEVNERLPDYARIAGWVISSEAFTAENGLATVNGRPRRDLVWQRFASLPAGSHVVRRDDVFPETAAIH